jgi:hypothetical protein
MPRRRGNWPRPTALDARIIAAFANHHQPAPQAAPTVAQEQLRALERQRVQLRRHLQQLRVPAAKLPEAKCFARLIAAVLKEPAALRGQLKTLLEHEPELAWKLRTIKGFPPNPDINAFRQCTVLPIDLG